MALSARKEGDKILALAALKCVKECDEVLKTNGSVIPPLPTAESVPRAPEPEATQQTTAPPPVAAAQRQFSRDEPIQLPTNVEDIPPPDPAAFGAPPPPKTVEEALKQRLEKYTQDEAKAKAEGNASKARRLGRVCKQYKDALRLNAAGKPIPVDDLPTPFGYGPIPVGQPKPAAPAPPAAPPAAATSPQGAAVAAKPQPTAAPRAAAPAAAAAAAKAPTSLKEKQLRMLQTRQALFREAALEAKKAGQMEQAKEYLRQFKGFDKLIEAAKCGLPVDFNTLPVPPQKQKGRSER